MTTAVRYHHESIIDRRLPIIVVMLVTCVIVLTARLFYLQIVQHQQLTGLALKQQERTIEIQPTRGGIFDRHGRPLALNRQVTSFYAVPNELNLRQAPAKKLAKLLGVSEKRLRKRFKSNKAFVWIKRKVSDQVAKQVEALNLGGIRSLNETMRVYPEGSLASHVLGFVGLDNQGLAGIELAFDRLIKGEHGWIRINRDARGRRVPTSTKVHKASDPGKDVYLTIDKVVQHVAEQALAKGLKKHQAKHGTVIVMDPKTGEILALANKPDFDPNHFSSYPALARKNRAVVDVYEPGSTFKIVTGSAALEEGILNETVIIDCEQGEGRFNGTVIRDHEPRGKLDFRDVLVYSSNIGAVKIGMRLGGEKLYNYTRQFGFGKTTGIGLPGEAKGLLQPLVNWKKWKAISAPFGQGLAVTSIQMANAFAAIANQGQLMRPWIIKQIKNPDGSVVQVGKPEYDHQVISRKTADKMKLILKDVVARGSGRAAAIDHYQVAGKTGTAQKPKKHGRGYDHYYHISSFVGFFPADDPQLLISVVIDSPKGMQWGGLVAGPIFREIGGQLVAYLGIPPGPEKILALSESEPKIDGTHLGGLVTVPDCRLQDIKTAKKLIRSQGLLAVRIGKGSQVLEQRPPAGALINSDSRVILYMSEQRQDVVVPKLKGQSMRNAIQIINAYGLHATVSGSGMVMSQQPQAYARVMAGQPCAINCIDPEKGQ